MPETRREFLSQGLAVAASLVLTEDWLSRAAALQQKAGDLPPERLAGDEDFWFDVQQAFTVDRSVINLNNGGVSPAARVAQDALRRHQEFSHNAPAKTMWEVLNPHVETVRERLADCFGCSPKEMAITRNASESLETCIYGIDLKAGDEVLATELDYPRMLTTYKQRAVREGIVLRQFKVPVPLQSLGDVVELYRQNLTDRTKVILVSHVVFLTGQIFPVRDIVRLGRERGIPVIVDGAHAFAHLAFKRDDLECDYYGTSLHKWMAAPHGAGFLYVRERCIPDLWPLMAAPEPRGDDIRKFEEIGTHPAANRLAIAEAITFHNAIGARRKEARLRYLRDRWARRLGQDPRVHFATRLEPEHGGAFTTFTIDGIDDEQLSKHLWNQHRIITVYIKHEAVHGLRISPSVYTTIDEIDLFSRAVEAVIANGLSS